MAEGIFLLQGDGSLTEMSESPYESESLLQSLLASYPHLLPGRQINSTSPRRWLLVTREMSLPGELDGAGRWSVDHLLLDQDGVPTIVEVKRSTDTRIRREVVGQMLDYAANAVTYWPVESIRSAFEQRCGREGLIAEELIAEHAGSPDGDVEAFWAEVKGNLQAGRIRMIFVADSIPRELQRVVEFLNGQMDPAEVLAVEVRQFASGQLKTFVPRVIGQTAQAQQKKQGGPPSVRGELWNWERFEADLRARSPALVNPARAILEWAEQVGLRVAWGQGKKDGSLMPVVDHGGEWYCPINVYSYGRIELQFERLRNKPPFDDDNVRAEFVRRVNSVPGAAIPLDSIHRRPAFGLDRVVDGKALASLLAALDWFVETARSRAQGAKSEGAHDF